MAEEKTRYSDAELEEFRALIEQKLASARADYEMLRSSTVNENDTEETPVQNMHLKHSKQLSHCKES